VKTVTRITAVTLVLALAFTAVGCSKKSSAVATVNGEAISREVFEAYAAYAVKQNQSLATAPAGDPELLKYQRLVLDSLINSELIRQAAKAEGASFSSADVDAKLEEIKASYPDEATFNSMIASSGMSMEIVRKTVEDNLYYEFLYDKVAPAGEVTDAEIAAYYEENKAQFEQETTGHLAHILFDATDKATAETALKEIKGGADFAAMAKKYSKDGSAENGGDLGTAPYSNYVDGFREAAAALAVGAVSELVESEFGWHIIKKIEETPGSTSTLEDVKSLISDTLKQNARDAAFDEYLTTKREAATIVIKDKALDAVGKQASGGE
jgi:parvulin-like peptidyl-prolyl isomerase